MTLWFETHATSLDNERRLASGHVDVDLSEAGRQQARALGMRYRELPVSIVYTSDLQRALATAAIAFPGETPVRRSDPRLRECDYGSWSLCKVEQVDSSRRRFIRERYPGGESYHDVARRLEQFLASLSITEQMVLIIGHRATWYALEHLLRKRDLHEVIGSPWQWQPGWVYEL